MYRKSVHGIVFLFLILSSAVSAHAALYSQTSTPFIDSFATIATSVSHADLGAGTARIPVSWRVTNRPEHTNLVFEQVFPDGRVRNVELPRDFVLVSSSGDGIVAPVDPGADFVEIRIQVRLVDLNDDTVYAQDEFTLPITDTTAYQSRIRFFDSTRTAVGRDELASGVVIPVSWGVDDYVSSTNLVFEQVFSDGRVVNVELPRDFLLVPPHGQGFVAPRSPGDNVNTIDLQVRLVDLPPGTHQYDRRELHLTVTDTPPASAAPQIAAFTVGVTNIQLAQLTAGAVRIPVSWSVLNRPPNTNLVFEQVFPDGTARNVELPRNFVLISSQGDGTVAPVLPPDSNRVQLRLRLVNLSNSQTITSAEITLPIFAPPSDIADLRLARGAECFDQPYSPTNGIGNVGSGRVNEQAANVNVFDAPLRGNIIGELAPGETFTVVDSVPACWRMPSGSNNQTEYRLWHVHTSQLDGWVREYGRGLFGMTYNIEPLDASSASSTAGCFDPPYEPDQGIRVGSRVRVTQNIRESGAGIRAVNMNLTDNSLLDVLSPGNVLTVVGGPVCRSELTLLDVLPIREWRIRTDSGDLEVWVHEYEISGSGVVYQLVPAG